MRKGPRSTMCPRWPRLLVTRDTATVDGTARATISSGPRSGRLAKMVIHASDNTKMRAGQQIGGTLLCMSYPAARRPHFAFAIPEIVSIRSLSARMQANLVEIETDVVLMLVLPTGGRAPTSTKPFHTGPPGGSPSLRTMRTFGEAKTY